MPGSSKTPFGDLPPAQQAGMLCNEPRFADFLRKVHQFPGEPRAFVIGWCNIVSSRDVGTDQRAALRFQHLRSDYDAWRGAIPKPAATNPSNKGT
ncbi:hypothetical protein [Parasedimentitalea psychrophila]|uniref:Uncharacterized protein n=1 Tax=Parasedimentitalea psychrophila TaxID=2997337 RepID=A0A9Y2P4B3_9RHOB|nr:hypothetical protein [Parasedimentitalea psychrophila]WIY25139.1 hypothetical protein QPJ95_22050 [Parasedimentitalea psychrophila]